MQHCDLYTLRAQACLYHNQSKSNACTVRYVIAVISYTRCTVPALHNMLGPPVTVTFVYAVKVLSASKVLCVWTDHPLGVGTRPFSRY